MAPTPEDDLRHPRSTIEEWIFAAWRTADAAGSADGALGVISGHRIVGRTAWYWAALARPGRPLLHVLDDDVPVRSDPFVIKGEAMWAEHVCDAPLEQWTIGNETYAAALADPADALGRAYGIPTPIAFDLEWYATEPPVVLDAGSARARSGPSPGEGGDEQGGHEQGDDEQGGYEQVGVVHGSIEILGESAVELVEIPARRWHRWTSADRLAPPALAEASAHLGARVPFRFPDGSVSDWVVTPEGWRSRPAR